MIVTTEMARSVGHMVLQQDHTSLAHQLAQAFGNATFANPEPRDLMEFVALNHDRGWDEVDKRMGLDPKSGLPYSLDKTPLDLLLQTIPHSIAFNEGHHLYCGLLVAMHIWGLYHGRYGLTDEIMIETLNGEDRKKADAALRPVKERIEQLTELLRHDPSFARMVEPTKLMQNYKFLQFCDRTSLYFNFCVAKEGEAIEIHHVPMDENHDTSVQLIPLGGKRYGVKPFPFKGRELALSLLSYEVPVDPKPFRRSEEWPELARATTIETLRLVPGASRPLAS